MNRAQRRRKAPKPKPSSWWEKDRRRQFFIDHLAWEFDCPGCGHRSGEAYEIGVTPEGYTREMAIQIAECTMCKRKIVRQTHHHVPIGESVKPDDMSEFPWLGETRPRSEGVS